MKNGLIGESRSGHLLFGTSGCRFPVATRLFGNSGGIKTCGQKSNLSDFAGDNNLIH